MAKSAGLPTTAGRAPSATASWQPDAAETVAGTASRRTAPRRWLQALHRAIEAGLVPGATPTTTVLAEDLAARMDFSTGHVRYRLDVLTARTGLGRSTAAKHVAILRRSGWLAWAQHGSLRNARREAGLEGYAPTAAVYAATIPPVFDELAGNVLAGSGYEARVVGVTEQERVRQVEEAGERAVRKAAETDSPDASWTPSLRVIEEEGQVQVSGGFSTTAKRQRKRCTILGKVATRDAVVRAKRVAAWVRPLVNWLQRATRRQLSWVLLDPVLEGWDDLRILRWLQDQSPLGTWVPSWPHRAVAAALRTDRTVNERAALIEAAEQAQAAQEQRRDASLEALFGITFTAPAQPDVPRTDDDRRQARLYALHDLALVAEHIDEFGLDDALDLYGARLCADAAYHHPTLIGA
ncbi:hypothetical protein [Kitasatospora cineracea]|uniref:hypothetical protein n=1 Tax=Kitasatospora cineracea TaxID=88074 RepID=UPI000F4DF1E0|nr:hypothetical protein [Kitasatospora cineracea]